MGRRKTAPVFFSCTPERKQIVQRMAERLTGGNMTALFDLLVDRALVDFAPKLFLGADDEETGTEAAAS